MKQYLLVNATFESSSILEDLLDNVCLKEIALGAKYKEPKLEYDNVLIPLILCDNTNQEFVLGYPKIVQHITQQSGITYSEDVYYSLFVVFKEVLEKSKAMSITITECIDEEQIDIFYTDGSFSKNTEAAAYACCKLLNEDVNGLIDDFTGRKFKFDAFSGKIENGTNNIGELTAIKVATQNFGDKKYQLVISDSIYGIKSYREYIHTWKKNGYKAYNKKPIKNKELITETYELLREKQNEKIVLLKWTKGHANNSFNEKCDEMAKKELGI